MAIKILQDPDVENAFLFLKELVSNDTDVFVLAIINIFCFLVPYMKTVRKQISLTV